MGIDLNSGILLEQGTNEFEMLSFKLDKNIYGINVSKVQEIIKYCDITRIPNSDSRILGVFVPRGTLITAIDLRMCLTQEKSEPPKDKEKAFLIICHFNDLTVAFQVDEVLDISRFSWKQIISPKEIVATSSSAITGIVKNEENIISILDFEQIVTEIDVNNGLTSQNLESISEKEKEENSSLNILIADDSKMLNKLISDALIKSGMNVVSTADGLEAWNYLKNKKDAGTLSELNCIVSDIEMPNKDGMSLCKDCKSDPEIGKLPFILFSSLADKAMEKKGESVGADAVFSKPKIEEVISKIRDLALTTKK